MAERRACRVAGVLAVMLAAACGDARPIREAPPREAPPSRAAIPADAPLDTAPTPPDTALSARVSRLGDGRLRLVGATRAAGELEVSVEDGHRVLFGPAPLPLREGRFSLEMAVEPTDQPTLTVFITTPDGARQWTLALAADSAGAALGVDR